MNKSSNLIEDIPVVNRIEITAEQLIALGKEGRKNLLQVSVKVNINCFECRQCNRCTNCNKCYNCNFCINTEYSTNCFNCFGCFNCDKCINCSSCDQCYECTDCFKCMQIIGGQNLKFVAYGIQLTEDQYNIIVEQNRN